MEFTDTILLLALGVIAIIIFDKKDGKFTKGVSGFKETVLRVLCSKEFCELHPLLHFNRLACLVRNEIVTSGRTNNQRFIKSLVEYTWELYKESKHYPELKNLMSSNSERYNLIGSMLISNKLKLEFTNQCFSVPVNMNLGSVKNGEEVSKELDEFFNVVYGVYPSVPYSSIFYKYNGATISAIANYIGFIKGFTEDDLTLPVDLLILSWLAERENNIEVRNYHFIPCMYWVVSDKVKDKKGITIVVCNLGSLKEDHKALRGIIATYLYKLGASVDTEISFNEVDTVKHLELYQGDSFFEEEFEAVNKGKTPHIVIKYQSEQYTNLISNPKNRLFDFP